MCQREDERGESVRERGRERRREYTTQTVDTDQIPSPTSPSSGIHRPTSIRHTYIHAYVNTCNMLQFIVNTMCREHDM